MTNKLTKYGLMIIAIVLLVTLVFAGAASASATITSATELQAALGGESYAVVVGEDTVKLINDVDLQQSLSIASGCIILDLNGHVLNLVFDNWQERWNPSITVSDSAEFILEDSNPGVSHKFSIDYSGRWYLDSDGENTINGGIITSPYSSTLYYAIMKINGKYTMNGGTIIGIQTVWDNIITVNDGGSFTMTNGGILHCVVGSMSSYYSVNIASMGSFNISGKLNISGNTGNGILTNVYLSPGVKINIVGPLDSEASIGITMDESGGVFTNGWGNLMGTVDPSLYFTIDDSNKFTGMRLNDANEAELVPVCRVKTKDGSYYPSITAALGAAESEDTIQLVSDINSTVETSISIDNKKITLDLNGFVVDSVPISVTSTGELILDDTNQSAVHYFSIDSSNCNKWYLDPDGTETVNGGIITSSGSIYSPAITTEGKFTMKNGNMVGYQNWWGSVVSINSGGIFTITGGKIMHCLSGNSNSCIYVSPATDWSTGGIFNLSGNPAITDNYDSYNMDEPMNVYLGAEGDNQARINIVGALDSNARIGISMGSIIGGAFTNGWGSVMGTADPSVYFTIDAPNRFNEISLNDEGEAQLVPPYRAKILGGNSYPSINLALAAASSGATIQLIADVDSSIDSSIVIDKDITLDLNGFVLNSVPITVCDSAELILDDSNQSASHKFSVDSSTGIWYLDSEGTKEVNGGIITGSYSYDSSPISVSGKFTMNGGNIVGCSCSDCASVVLVNSNGKFTMTGGSIVGSGLYEVWSGVLVKGAVYMVDSTGTFNLSGNPVISDNYLMSSNGYTYLKNVCLQEGAKINIVGALSDDAKIGVSMENPDVFTNGWKSFMSGEKPADYFSSDITKYTINETSAGEVEVYAQRVAEIVGGKTYLDIQSAIDSAMDGQTVRLIADATESISLTSRTITLDLNGFMLNGGSDSTSGTIISLSSSQLNLIDSNASVQHRFTVDDDGQWVLDPAGERVIYGGCIICSDDCNYGIYVSAGYDTKASTFTMDGGNLIGLNLSDNYYDNSAVVYLQEPAYGEYCTNKGGCFTMNGGTINGCNSGAVAVYIPSYYMSGKTSGNFKMTGGNITGCTGEYGAVYLDSHGIFEMTGGNISSCSGEYGAIYMASSYCNVNMSGNPNISENTCSNGNKQMNLCLPAGNKINIVGELEDSAHIGISMVAPDVFTNGWKSFMLDKDPANYFISDNTKLTVQKTSEKEAELFGEIAYNVNSKKTYASITAAVNDADVDDTIQLIANDEELVQITKNITLDLNGYVLSGVGDIITVDNWRALTLMDSNSSIPHRFSINDEGHWILDSSGDKIVYGGVITGYGNQGSGRAVFLVQFNEFTMNGGSIVGYTDGTSAIYATQCVFMMNHGNVTECTGNSYGGVCVGYDCEFLVSGLVNISGNTGSDKITPCNVYISNDLSDINLTITDTLDSGTQIGVSMQYPGVFTSGWESHMSGKDPSDYFTSDVSNLQIVREGNELKLYGEVARIGETVYPSLPSAFRAVQPGETIVLLTDISDSGETVTYGQLVTLDLNGHILSSSGTNALISITGSGDFILNDSSPKTEHRFSVNSEGQWIPDSDGDKVIKGGVLLGTPDSCAVFATSIGSSADSFTMNGGTIVGFKGWSVVYGGTVAGGAVTLQMGGEFTMNGGSIIDCNGGYGAVYLEYDGYYCGHFTISGDAYIDAVSPVYLGGLWAGSEILSVGQDGFTSENAGIYNISMSLPEAGLGGTVIADGASAGDHFALSSYLSQLYALSPGTDSSQIDDLVLSEKGQSDYIKEATASVDGYVYGTNSIPEPVLSNPSVASAVSFYYSTAANTVGTLWNELSGTTLDAGTYYVYAKENGGTAESKRSTFKVSRADQEEPGVTVAGDEGFVTVTVGGGSKVDNYEYTIVEGTEPSYENWISASGDVFNIAGLKASQQYAIAVRAKESINYNASSASVKTASTQSYFTVNYNANGGTGIIPLQKSPAGTPIVAQSGNGFVRDGYAFAGWKNSTGDAVAVGAEIVDSTTLYAQWNAKSYTITFNNDGSITTQQLTYGDVPVALNPVVGSKAGFVFAGWSATQNGAILYRDEQLVQDIGDITLYAVWTENPHTITVTVIDASLSPVTVKLMSGNALIDEKAASPYEFINIPSGVYDIVAETASGKTVTKMVTLASQDESVTLTIPTDDVSSRVEISAKANTPATVVGNLDEEAKAKAESGKSVIITIAVEAKVDGEVNSTASQTEKDSQAEIEKIKEGVSATSPSTSLQFLEITVNKTADTDSEKVYETSNVIEIAVSYDFTNKKDIVVYRCHDNIYEEFTLVDQNVVPHTDGTYAVDADHGVIYIYATKFSMYSIGYTAITPTPQPSSSGSSSHQTGYTQILQDGEVIPTLTPTAAPTEQPATPTVIATVKPTSQPTQQSPAPFVGLLAGLGVAAVVLRLRK